ncbi:MAG: CPBP family intramembrane glutamic endopeptidase, partial [Gemmatimonadales bacterium]
MSQPGVPARPAAPSPRALLVSAILFEGALFGLGLLFLWLAGLGLVWRVTASELAAGVVLGLLLAGAVAALVQLEWSWLAPLRRDVRRLAETFASAPFAVVLAVSVLAGVAEEVLFRGFLQGWLAGWVGPTGALVAAAAVFGLAHAISWRYATLVTLLGLCFGWLYLATGSIWPPIVGHALYDMVALLYGQRWLRALERAEAGAAS